MADDTAADSATGTQPVTPTSVTPAPHRPRWKVKASRPLRSTPATRTPSPATIAQPTGTAALLTNRLLLQGSAGSELLPLLPYIAPERSGLVLSRGRLTAHRSLNEFIAKLPHHGFDGPTVFDPEAYRHHTATVAEPFQLDPHRVIPESLDDHITQQKALGVNVAQTPTGYIQTGQLDSLETAAEIAYNVDRDDFIFQIPFDAEILDNERETARLLSIVNAMNKPVAFILVGQFNPLDRNAGRRVEAIRRLNASATPTANLRTDFNAFDLMGRGAFTGAIGTGGTKRHAVAPGSKSFAADPTNPSPSVLYPRIAAWWRGTKINEMHGRTRPPTCECGHCDHQSLGRFLSRDDTADAQAHNLTIWQDWAQLLLRRPNPTARAEFWRTFCQGRVSETAVLSDQLGLAKPLTVRAAFEAWSTL